MNIFIYLLLLFLLITVLNAENIVVISLTEFFGSYYTPVYIGKSKEVKRIKVDLETNVTSISNVFYTPENEKGVEIKTTNIRNKTFSYKLICEPLSINNFTVQDFCYYYILSKSTPSEGLTFSYKPEKKLSLTHILLRDGKIEKLSFGFNSKELQLFLGGIPSQITKKKYSSSCKVDTNSDFWNCKLQYIEINKEKLVINQDIIFTLSSDQIEMPKNFYEIFKNKYLIKDSNEKEDCYEMEFIEVTNLYCKCSLISKKLKEIYLVIGGLRIPYHKSLTRKLGSDYCRLLIGFNMKNMWKIGGEIYNEHIPLFDYSRSEIFFYGDEPINFNSSLSFKKSLFIWTMIILFIGFINILLSRFK